MLPPSFRGEGVEEAHTSAQNDEDATQNTSQRPRTIMMRNPLDVPIMTDMIGFQDSYDALLPSTSQDPHHLIGFQADPERQEQQKQQELAERQAAKAPIDLRDVLNRKEQSKIEQLVQKKRARDLANSDATNSSPNPSPVHLVQRLVLAKANSCLISFLIFAKNQRNWINAILNTLDPAGALKLRAQLAENIETLLAWVYSAWVNVSGVMSILDDSLSQKPNSNSLPGFLFPSQVASLMLVETEDLVPMIAPIVWPIFGSMMALRYPTQPLRVAAKAPTLSILHFVDPEDDTRQPGFQMLVRNFANFRPPMAYTIIKDKKQVEYNFSALIRARARCAVPMSLELHPVEWLHAPVEPTTGALQGFASWDEPGFSEY